MSDPVRGARRIRGASCQRRIVIYPSLTLPAPTGSLSRPASRLRVKNTALHLDTLSSIVATYPPEDLHGIALFDPERFARLSGELAGDEDLDWRLEGDPDEFLPGGRLDARRLPAHIDVMVA